MRRGAGSASLGSSASAELATSGRMADESGVFRPAGISYLRIPAGDAREGDLWVATFRDPSGNVLGVWRRGPR